MFSPRPSQCKRGYRESGLWVQGSFGNLWQSPGLIGLNSIFFSFSRETKVLLGVHPQLRLTSLRVCSTSLPAAFSTPAVAVESREVTSCYLLRSASLALDVALEFTGFTAAMKLPSPEDSFPTSCSKASPLALLAVRKNFLISKGHDRRGRVIKWWLVSSL